ncbi:MAG: QcrA and Rieske domain-containing protein [Solirubrobacteraceae bacterium]
MDARLTEELGTPGAFEGETVSRRRFMTGTAHTAGAIAAAAFTLPALAFAVGPVFDRQPATWQRIGPLGSFNEVVYKPVVVQIEQGVGEAGTSLAYVRLHNEAIDGHPRDRYDHIIALSSRCAHVGCPVRYVQAAESFVCPCHGGVYTFKGLRVGGPPPRPLDRFYTLIQDGQVLLGPRFSVNNELQRFSLRDPGQPLDGIGQYLYPPRFTTPPAPPGA